MNASQIIAAIFILVSLAALTFLLFDQKLITNKKYKPFFVASAVVWFTGTVFIGLIILKLREVPTAFALISELTVAFVFIVTFFVLRKTVITVDEIKKAADEGRIKAIEENEEEDKE